VQPDLLLNDVVAVATGTTAQHRLTFLRNMLTEGVGNLRTCADFPAYVGCRPAAADLAAQCTSVGAPGPALSAAYGVITCVSTSAAASISANVSALWFVTDTRPSHLGQSE
jgi:hypothetical protein